MQTRALVAQEGAWSSTEPREQLSQAGAQTRLKQFLTLKLLSGGTRFFVRGKLQILLWYAELLTCQEPSEMSLS